MIEEAEEWREASCSRRAPEVVVQAYVECEEDVERGVCGVGRVEDVHA